MTEYFALPPILGLAGLAVAFIIYHIMSRHNFGDGKVKKIGDQIHLGAMVFIHREYKMMARFAILTRFGWPSSIRDMSLIFCSSRG